MHRSKFFVILSLVSALPLFLASAAAAASVGVKATMRPAEQIYTELPAPGKHFVLLVRREGRANGTGILDGADLTEYGMHDIRPGTDGAARGYLVARLPGGGQGVLQWELQATFVPGPDGKPRLLDNGVWRLVSGTGSLQGARGAGILRIRVLSPTDREFELTGEIVAPR